MTTRILWLHVGIPKTSTTSFQSWMREHAAEIERSGLSYPPLFGQGNDKHNFLVGALRRDKELSVLKQLLETTEAPNLLLSDEGLSNHLDDFDPASIERFRQLTENWAVKILLLSRDGKSWTRSYHKQCVLNPDNGASPLWGTHMTVAEISSHPRIERLLETDSLAADLQTAFGAERVHHFQYEDPNWFEACLNVLGVNMAGELPQSNKSLPDWAIEVLRRVNAMTSNQNIRKGWKMALQSYLSSNHTILTNLSSEQEVVVEQGSLVAIKAALTHFPTAMQNDVGQFLEQID